MSSSPNNNDPLNPVTRQMPDPGLQNPVTRQMPDPGLQNPVTRQMPDPGLQNPVAKQMPDPEVEIHGTAKVENPAPQGTTREEELPPEKQSGSKKLSAAQSWILRVGLFGLSIGLIVALFWVPTQIMRSIDSWLNPLPPLTPTAKPLDDRNK